jgi:hypothetical protein
MIGTTKRRRLAAAAMSALSLAAAVPATAAATRPDDRAGVRGPTAATSAQRAVRPDDRAGVRGPLSASRMTHAVVATSRTFDWGDAATGGAVTFGAISVLGQGVLASRRRGRIAHSVVMPSERSA